MPRVHTKKDANKEAAKYQLIDLFSENPKISLRKAACAVGMTNGSVQRFVKEGMHLKPYKSHECHHLEPTDYPKPV